MDEDKYFGEEEIIYRMRKKMHLESWEKTNPDLRTNTMASNLGDYKS